MKTARILSVMGIVLVGLMMTTQASAFENKFRKSEKSALILTVDKPVIEYMAKAYTGRINASDILRMQKTVGQIRQMAVSFTDPDASDLIFRFEPLDGKGLEGWMFNEGYLTSDSPSVPGISQDISVSVEKIGQTKRKSPKTAINLTIDRPIIEYLSRIYAGEIDEKDIIRLQKMCGKIEHITVSFCESDACDYVLRFKELDELGLEEWMFSEGYLTAATESDSVPVEPWMLDMHYLE